MVRTQSSGCPVVATRPLNELDVSQVSLLVSSSDVFNRSARPSSLLPRHRYDFQRWNIPLPVPPFVAPPSEAQDT